MGKILEFSSKQPDKFDFERVKKRRTASSERRGQMNLFSTPHVLRMPPNVGPFEEALVLDERGDSRAMEAYLRSIEEGDDVADAYCNLGIMESKAGHTARAFDCFTKSLEHDPRHFESHYNLGNLYLDAGDLRLARVHYEMAAELDSSFPNLYFNLGLALALNNELAAALSALDTYKSLAAESEGKKADELIFNLRRSMGDAPAG
jgi:Flp pilus assembly protein TadD